MKKLTLSFTLLLSTTIFAQVPNYVPTNGLVGWWPFNGNANDESGNGNNGTVNGATLTTDRNGVANKAYNFDGVDDKIIITAQSSIPQQSNYTVSLWFKSAISTYNGAFISFGAWFCKLGHDSPGFFYKDEIGNSSNTFYEQAHFGVQPIVNTWNHLILKKTNNTITLILNNSIIGNMTTYGFSNFNPSSLMQIGYYCCQEYFSGSIDDTGVWNRALTNCEISNLYNSHLGPLNLSAGSDLSICNGNTVALIASGAATYAWNNNVMNAQPFAPTTTHNYILTGTDSFGCTGTDTVKVTVNPIPLILAGNDQSICSGDLITLSASGGAIYTWDNNVINSQAFIPTTTQTYIVTGTDTLGCVGSDTVQITVLATSSSSQTQSALDAYTWPVNNQTYSQSGTYSDTLVNAAGCDSIVTLNLTLSYTGINELSSSTITISPNPTSDYFTLTGLELFNIISSMTIKDVNGKTIKELDPKAVKFSLGSAKAGVYFLSITAGNKQEVVKLIKE